MTDSPEPSSELDVVRIKLGPDRAAPQPDPLGRERIGYAPGLSVNEVWERGRGVWKAKLPSVAAASLLVLVAEGFVVGVGTIEGVSFVGDRIAINGRPDPTHPLLGQPDPIPNTSRNPPAYGRVRTVPASPAAQRPFQTVLNDAIRILTEGARLRSPRLQPLPSGGWGSHPTETDPADWPELVTLALAGAAANVGGIDTALAGRPGSWEADKVRSLLESTVGADEAALWEHRTEPVRITVNLDEILSDADQQYEQARDEIFRRQESAEKAEPAIDTEEFTWVYDISAGEGNIVPRSPEAPAWSWESWRDANRASGVDPAFLEAVEKHIRDDTGAGITSSLYIPKNPEAGATLNHLDDERAARLSAYDELEERLEQQRLREWTTYGQVLKKKIVDNARDQLGLRVPIEIRIDLDTPHLPNPADRDSLEEHLIDAAAQSTPTPADLPGTPLQRLESRA